MNKTIKLILASVTTIILVFAFLIFVYGPYKAKKQFVKAFMNDISPKPEYLGTNSRITQQTTYNYVEFLNKNAKNVETGKLSKLSDIAKNQNLFINFWFKGCGGCEKEMPDIETLYKSYKDKIQFIVVSNDSIEVVRKYVKKNNFTLPFYVLEDRLFPSNISVFPTTHLVIKNKTIFTYPNMGYYDSSEFYTFIDNALATK